MQEKQEESIFWLSIRILVPSLRISFSKRNYKINLRLYSDGVSVVIALKNLLTHIAAETPIFIKFRMFFEG